MTFKSLGLALSAFAFIGCNGADQPATQSPVDSVAITPPETEVTVEMPALASYDWNAVRQAEAWTTQGSNTALSTDGTSLVFRDEDTGGYDNVRRFLSVDGDGATVVELDVDAAVREGQFAMVRFTLTDPERTRLELGFAPDRDVWHFNSTVMNPTLSCEMLSATSEQAKVKCQSDVPFKGVMIDVFPAFGAAEKGYAPDATGIVAISDLDVVLR